MGPAAKARDGAAHSGGDVPSQVRYASGSERRDAWFARSALPHHDWFDSASEWHGPLHAYSHWTTSSRLLALTHRRTRPRERDRTVHSTTRFSVRRRSGDVAEYYIRIFHNRNRIGSMYITQTWGLE